MRQMAGILRNNYFSSGEMVAELPFNLIKDLLDPEDVIIVTAEEMIEGMRLAAERMKLVIEMSAGAAVAGALKVTKKFPEVKRIGVVLCGGNVDLQKFASILG